MIAIDAQLRAAGQHAIAPNTADGFHADGDVTVIKPGRQFAAPQTTVFTP